MNNRVKTVLLLGALTGLILFCLPACIGLFMFIMTPDYFKPMITSEAGRAALWFAAFLQISGALIIRKIVNIKV